MVDVTGIIVAGGRSSRMGQDKAMLQLGGVAVLERISAVLGQVAQRVIVVARDTQQYRRFGLEMTTDLYPSLGPLSGIHAGLSASNTEWGLSSPVICPSCSQRYCVPWLPKQRTGERCKRQPVTKGNKKRKGSKH